MGSSAILGISGHNLFSFESTQTNTTFGKVLKIDVISKQSFNLTKNNSLGCLSVN